MNERKQTTWYQETPNDSLQFFREEQVEGAVYDVYLKKEDDDATDDRSSFLQWRMERIQYIKLGSLERLVEALTHCESGELDSTFMSVFLATFRSFSGAKQILNIVFDRYKRMGEKEPKMKQHIKETHRRSLRSMLGVWLNQYKDDFNEPPNFPCLRLVVDFCRKNIEGNSLHEKAELMLQKCLKDEATPTDDALSLDEIDFSFSLSESTSRTSSSLERPVDFLRIPSVTFAEQLTFIDSELFKAVVPHQCLGSVWSRRDKKGVHAPSVYATVEQFNSVSYRVIATLLKNPDVAAADRAQIIRKWLDVAQELRFLKNFSSLKAILSGLQSNSVYRLKSVWNLLDKDYQAVFTELAAIFSDDNNQSTARELLVREGTAKYAEQDGFSTLKSSKGHKRNRSAGSTLGISTTRSKKGLEEVMMTPQGTVPYLGTFLTDLTMIHTAHADTADSGLINFEKKRKEFELLAQIKMLQAGCRAYSLKADPVFFDWFNAIRTYDEKESYDLSMTIEPAEPSTPSLSKTHRKRPRKQSESLRLLATQQKGLAAGAQMFASMVARPLVRERSLDASAAAQRPASPLYRLGFFSPRRPSESDDLSNLSGFSDDGTVFSTSGSTIGDSPSMRKTPILKQSLSVSSLRSMDSAGSGESSSPWRSPESCIVKVSLETLDIHESFLYKSIQLSNRDHTRTVLSNSLKKFNFEDEKSLDDYILFQVINDEKELSLPERGNVFYAMDNSVAELKFVIRKRSELEKLKQANMKYKWNKKGKLF